MNCTAAVTHPSHTFSAPNATPGGNWSTLQPPCMPFAAAPAATHYPTHPTVAHHQHQRYALPKAQEEEEDEDEDEEQKAAKAAMHLKKHPKLRATSFEDIRRIVDTNAKQRFSLSQDAAGEWQIRANQGHSVEVNIPMQPVLTAADIPAAIHGTTRAAYALITESGGLRPMGRQHIHLATGDPSRDATVISGMRASAQVLIYINVKRALDAGVEFWRSENGVVLTKGLGGVLGCEFFEKVVDRDGRPIS
ncbi:hypothetical protein HDU86_001908 [Geranomyces michiganensis]|nr:hypothetical protein HDU86_001908 [Geranomyces michiganensis]